MRELKFRVWDKLANNFIYPDKGYQGHFIIDLNGRFHNLQNGSGGDEYIVQQFTGLKDSKGKDIFDGDIVEGEFYDEDDRATSVIKYEVVFNNGAFNIASRNWYKPSLKIIGNIFENLDLVK